MKKSQIKSGEDEALKIALEERRKIKSEAQAKKDIEEKDCSYAKQVVLIDVESDHQHRELCAKDDDYARNVYNMLQDEIYAEDLAKKEEDEIKLNNLLREEEDMKVAQEQQEILDKEIAEERLQQAKRDHKIAKKSQLELDNALSTATNKQQRDDAIVSYKLNVKTLREEHRRIKAKQMRNKVLSSSADEITIGNQWRDADAEVEDVANGICMTIILPNMRDLKIIVAGERTIEIDAERMVYEGNEIATPETSYYGAEFLIDGKDVHIADEDTSYEYTSESGLLFVYVDKVHLEDDEDECEGKQQDSNDSKIGKSILGSLKRGFSRVFGKK
jgi:hypothetical protein